MLKMACSLSFVKINIYNSQLKSDEFYKCRINLRLIHVTHSKVTIRGNNLYLLVINIRLSKILKSADKTYNIYYN